MSEEGARREEIKQIHKAGLRDGIKRESRSTIYVVYCIYFSCQPYKNPNHQTVSGWSLRPA